VASAIAATNILPLVDSSAAGKNPSSSSDAASFAGALKRAELSPAVRLVQATRTRLDAGQASQALASAYREVVGEEPPGETVKILTAQWAHETGNGASMFNYNFGGIKGAGPEGLSVAQRTREGWGKSETTIVDNFRAYRTAEEGATDYVRLLVRRFPQAVEAARAGDPEGFVRGLKSRGYFTGNEAAYTRSIVALSGVALPEGSSALPPALDAPYAGPSNPMLPASTAGAEFVPPPALVDALAMADEISRAALRIARATDPARSSG
jgi:hypothetical protein